MATFDVLIPVKNCRKYLQESIESICQQTFRDWRLFVLDHSSTDGSYELACRYAERDRRVIVNTYPETTTLSGLHNHGLDLCDGKYLLRQDADDISLPERMEVLSQAFEANPNLTCIGSLGDIINGGGEKIGTIDMPTGRHAVSALSFFRSPILHPTSAMRLDDLHRFGARYGIDFIGAIPPEQRLSVPTLCEDYFLFGQLSLLSSCMNLDRSLIKYRWHGSNISIKRSIEQLQVSLNVSRSLAKSFSILHGTPEFDPAPFCNHGERLFAIDDRIDFRNEYEEMRQSLSKVFPPSYETERELAFRKAIAHRFAPSMMANYCEFAFRYGKRRAELRTVRSWILRGLVRQPHIKLNSSMALA